VEELSEQEQWEQLKGWVRTNGPQVLILVAVMLLGVYGWKWWQGRGAQQAQAASAAYQAVIAKFDDNKMADGVALIETLRSTYPKSPYVAAADLVAARVFVEANQLDKAAERLQRVATTAKDEKLRPIATIRLAKVQAAQGKYDVALATLGNASFGVHEAARLEERGDILLAKGDRKGALAEYEAARKLEPASSDTEADTEGTAAAVLDLKIADLGGQAAPAASAAAPAPPAATAPAKAATP